MWRPLFWIVAAIALLAFIMAALTFEDSRPADLDAPRDLMACVGDGRVYGSIRRRRAADLLAGYTTSRPPRPWWVGWRCGSR